jgi:plasmid stability protein
VLSLVQLHSISRFAFNPPMASESPQSCAGRVFRKNSGTIDMIETRRGPMTLTIDLPDEQTTALAAKARAHGLSTEQYVRLVLQHDLAPEWLRKSWESSEQAGLDRLSADEIEAEIGAARKARRESPQLGA